jgi:hypothetical protein
MNPIVAEALAALPRISPPSPRRSRKAVRRGVPVGRLQRGWILGSLQVRIAGRAICSRACAPC